MAATTLASGIQKNIGMNSLGDGNINGDCFKKKNSCPSMSASPNAYEQITKELSMFKRKLSEEKMDKITSKEKTNQLL